MRLPGTDSAKYPVVLVKQSNQWVPYTAVCAVSARVAPTPLRW